MNEDNKIFKTNEFSIEISPVGKAIQAKDIQYFSYDENSGLQLIHILMDGKPLDLPNGTEIRLSAVKINNQNQKLIYTPEIVDPLKGIVSFVIPREFLGYQGKIRCGLYINFSNNQTMHVGYFYINMGVSDIDTNLTEFTEDFWQGWSEFEAGSTAKMQELEQRIDEQTEIFNNADVFNKAEIEDKLEPFALRTDIDTLETKKADKTDVNQLATDKADKTALAETDAEVAELESSKADKTALANTNQQVSGLASNKVDKGGASQVTMGMLSQEVKTAITGGSVAVVGKDAVSTTNIVDESVTTAKASRLVQSGKFVSSNPIVINFKTGQIDIPAGTFVSNKLYLTTIAQTIYLDKNYMQMIFIDTKTSAFFGSNYTDLSDVSQGAIQLGVVQFQYNNAVLNASWTGNRARNSVLPTNFHKVSLNTSDRLFSLTIDNENSKLVWPVGGILVGTSYYTFNQGEYLFSVSESTVCYICFDISTLSFFVIDSVNLSELNANSTIVGNFHSSTLIYDFPGNLVINDRAKKAIDLAHTNSAMLYTIGGYIDISFAKKTITIPPRISIAYFNGTKNTNDITGGSKITLDYSSLISKGSVFVLMFNLNKSQFEIVHQSDINKTSNNTIYLAYFDDGNKKAYSPYPISIEGQLTTNGEYYSYHREDEEQTTSSPNVSSRVDVNTRPGTVTEFEFLAKRDESSSGGFEIRFYHQDQYRNQLFSSLGIESLSWKPYKVKVNTPSKGTAKMICIGNGKIKNVIAKNVYPRRTPKEFQNILSLSHRGSNYFAPENTIEGFVYSNSMGFMGNEFDVDRTSDGFLVLSHDATIDRCSNGIGVIRQMTYEELLTYDFGYLYNAKGYKDVKIPTLDEALGFHKKTGQIPYIELKNGCITKENAQEFVDLLVKHGLKDKCFVMSFDFAMLKCVSDVDNTISLGWGVLPTDESINQLKSLGPNCFCSIYGWDTTNYSTYEPYADICIANNIPFTGSSKYLDVQGKVIEKGAFCTALDDINVNDCYF